MSEDLIFIPTLLLLHRTYMYQYYIITLLYAFVSQNSMPLILIRYKMKTMVRYTAGSTIMYTLQCHSQCLGDYCNATTPCDYMYGLTCNYTSMMCVRIVQVVAYLVIIYVLF